MTYTTLAQTVQLYDALHDAIFNDTALAILYNTNGEIVKSRTIHPLDITAGTKGSDLIHAHDSLRGSIVTFRVDRVVAWESASDEPHQDWEDSPQAWGVGQ